MCGETGVSSSARWRGDTTGPRADSEYAVDPVGVATISPSGPHVSPLWFLWHDDSIWLYSITSSQRFRDLERDPRVAVVVDDGHEYGELRGVELSGRARVVGEVERGREDHHDVEQLGGVRHDVVEGAGEEPLRVVTPGPGGEDAEELHRSGAHRAGQVRAHQHVVETERVGRGP